MNKNSLQYDDADASSSSAKAPLKSGGMVPLDESHDSLLVSGLAKDATLAEVLKSIGQDCTQEIESYLERCETRQEGE